MSTPRPPWVLLMETDAHGQSRWLRFTAPRRVITTNRLAEVRPALDDLETEVAAGRWAAGFLTYEAAPAFDPALTTHAPGTLPLLWWGIFDAPQTVPLPTLTAPAPTPNWNALLSPTHYREALARIHDYIARGDTYQVNYTFQLAARFSDDPFALFLTLCRAQRGGYSAYVDAGPFAVLSASPELFFARDGEQLRTRPMKGTARRGRTWEEDRAHAAALTASAKERAENVMIVDMVRNDLGRIALPGSVCTTALCAVETYPTVLQLTSTVTARSRAPFGEILAALFPSASITGAPKVRTMEIIRELEDTPRGVYTGAVGFVAPNRRAQLNVAIRTITVDRQAGEARYGTGGGIVWDSVPEAEYAECRTKALVLTTAPPPFALLETLRWQPRRGYFLLDRHLDRLLASAAYFDYPANREEIAQRLHEAARHFPPQRQRVRLRLAADGDLRIEAQPWPCTGRVTWRLAFDDRPVDLDDPFLYHKTTHRQRYDDARRRHPDADEVVLWNPRGELTETTRTNLVLKVGAQWLTPPLSSGLLPGTYRAALLARGRLREAVLRPADLSTADGIYLINALRGFLRGTLIDTFRYNERACLRP